MLDSERENAELQSLRPLKAVDLNKREQWQTFIISVDRCCWLWLPRELLLSVIRFALKTRYMRANRTYHNSCRARVVQEEKCGALHQEKCSSPVNLPPA
jgi:hypothetical protein